MRLHVGAGSVYLADWVNVDLPLPNVFLAKERPDLVERYVTSEGDYYGRHKDKTAEKLAKGPMTQETACDVYGSFTFLPTRDNAVSEILSRQVFEHLTISEAKRALDECYRVMKPNGSLRLDVPDPDETMRLYLKTGEDVYLRHLFGPRKDIYGGHTPYNRRMLTSLVESYGFQFEAEEENIHWYPAFCLRFKRV